MNPRERVITAILHKEPDRIPIDFGGGVSSIMKRAYINLCNSLNIDHKDAKYTIFDTVMDIDEIILRKFNIDFRRVWLGEPLNAHVIKNSDGSIIDIFGIKRKMVGEYMEIISPPLNGAGINYIKNYRFPNPEDKGWISGVEERARNLSENSSYAVVLVMSLDGVFESGTYLFGFEDFLIKLYTEKKLVNYFFDKLLDFETTFWSFVLKKIGQYIDIIELGDDMANQRQLFFSKEIYREMIKPRHLILFSSIKKYTQAKLFLHCCGSVVEIIDELIDVGIDILNPVQPGAFDMRAKDLKNNFGNSICFHG